MKNELKKLRKERGLTQSELAEKLMVSQQLVAAWESGRSTPRPYHMQILQNCFNIPKEEIFFGAFNYKNELNKM